MSALVLDFQEARRRSRSRPSVRDAEIIRSMVTDAGGSVILQSGGRNYITASAEVTNLVVYITRAAEQFLVGAYDVTIASFTSVQEAIIEALKLASESASGNTCDTTAG